MSRGLGKWQRWVWGTILSHGKPMTFEDFRAALDRAAGVGPDMVLRPSVARSLRRALHGMTETGGLIAMGDGGRTEPFRYFIHPLWIGTMGKTPEADALIKALENDPGAEKAAAVSMAKMFAPSIR
ncbi:hypothetical protein [Bradyrhizobium sp. CCGUVB23]|uniref:hypothetical protein n=1 Tax=Bradyrhizobium sp. CCGUVB23 TaxID=2949630 RepID=UPI0020B403BD|nr:hypothetical protein [Bradyrhizobium sp. CCGUVB23]MCP3462539.1 hypothetical protein [Bradyrhizobium sp. CCGUVB23]